MSANGGPDIITNGLVLSLDAADIKSYRGSGTSWNDRIIPINGTLINSPTYNGKSFQFTRNNSTRLDIPNDTKLQITEGLTIYVWFKPYNYAVGRQGLIGRDGLNEYTITLETNGGVSLYFESVGQSGNYYNGFAGAVFGQQNNVWQLLTVTRDTSKNLKMYKNGILTASNNMGAALFPNTHNVVTTIAYGNGGYFEGEIAVVALYNRALSQEEILQNYNASKSRFQL